MSLSATVLMVLLLAKAETPPLPVSTLPFRRDPDFISRPELDLLQQRLSYPSARVALFGIGGVGKSQLAIEYCYRLRERLRDTWVLWIHASNAARFEESIRDAVDQLRIAGRNDPKADILQLFHSWLQDQRNGTWLIVLDNADKASYLLQPSTRNVVNTSDSGTNAGRRRLYEYLPTCPQGSVIVTTRNREMAAKLVDDADMVTVEPMGEQIALDLLEKRIGLQSESKPARQLVAALEYMPLAISQAAAYIKQRGSRSSIQQYLEKFEKDEKSRTRLLSISFEHIHQYRRSAADLLSLMSFFDHQGIPESILRLRHLPRLDADNGSKQTLSDDGNTTDSSSELSADEEMEEDIITLRNYSFVSGTPHGAMFKMHRLVQIATLKWLKSHDKDIYWLEQSLLNLDEALPHDDYADWTECRALLPHARLAFNLKPETRDASLHQASISNKAAAFLLSQGFAIDAHHLAKGSMASRRELLGDEHPSTLTSMANLAATYRDQGRWKEGEELEVSVMEARKKVLGDEHPDTLTSMADLAATYWNQKRWKEAEELNVSVMEARKK
ncbi:hypothetical protein D6D28_10273, partial [Aureobasidium pullulans]